MLHHHAIRIALAGLNQIPMDWHGNLSRIRKAFCMARDLGAEILCFPELALSGYGCEDAFLHPDTAARALAAAQTLAAEVENEVILAGLPLWVEGRLYNAVAVMNQGQIRGFVLKSHLAREGIHYEPRWFQPWPPGTRGEVDLDGRPVPVGSLRFRRGSFQFAMEICEDAWVDPDARPCRLLQGTHFIFNASASHFSMGKADIRERIVADSSSRFGVGYGYANLVGCESGRAIYDGELLVADGGAIVNRSKRLYLDDCLVMAHDFRYNPSESEVEVTLPAPRETRPTPPLPVHTERIYPSREEEFAKAASLALFDYMRKSRSRGFTLSLSGGVDSSTVAVLVWVMANRVLNELSLEDRKEKLSYFSGLELDVDDAGTLAHQLLTTVYQATRNSGSVTRLAASGLAEAVGAVHLELDVDPLVAGYTQVISQAIDRELTWSRDDIALQNIQARVRGPSVWMLANLSGSLLLSTSNRSEVAVGYATMDGDTCGGLAPIAGVEKTFLRTWLRHMEREGLATIPPLPILSRVNEQEPTAELRPPDQVQQDEKDLMPYEVLDALEDALIGRRRPPAQAFADLRQRFDGYPARTLLHWTAKFCRMFATTQWKRERYAPAFHLDDSNLDPKTWARYPILSGSFAAELAELERAFDEGTLA
ncbi:Glutamine-dependent NAD(+) synthetase [Sulfidibacter corallicola]|uniref:Glutamine-dependent NAD(+) synthetase n=1 Tax=Sulfidibacter corallicola TaxID=2818388 RepID=A0A8A4TVZ6_SULCO|nr:NAD(+) synthase [Sulfidibacter corallicola]QTD54136.1 NAD(+) synthase [Sulfidibacter corallicola]